MIEQLTIPTLAYVRPIRHLTSMFSDPFVKATMPSMASRAVPPRHPRSPTQHGRGFSI